MNEKVFRIAAIVSLILDMLFAILIPADRAIFALQGGVFVVAWIVSEIIDLVRPSD